MSELDVPTARWLTSPEGLENLRIVTNQLDQGESELQILERLRAKHPEPRRTAAVLAAGLARRRARGRWHDAERLVFTRESLEQASDPAVSAWRSRRFSGFAVHDLCAGVGGDTMALARTTGPVTAVDIDPARLVLLDHNAAAADLEITTLLGDALSVEVPPGHLVHADPARRRDGRRITDPTRTLPPVDRVLAVHGGTAGRGVVLAPGVDASDPALGDDTEVEYVQLGDQLLEAVAWSGVLRNGRARASATVLPRIAELTDATEAVAHRFRTGERDPLLPVRELGDTLIEVAPSAIRARLHDEIGAEIGAHRVARSRALLSVSGEVPASPWYRAREILEVLPARANTLRTWLAGADRGPVELVLHGVQVEVEPWWRAMGRPPRGPDGIRIELVRRDRDRVAIVTRA